MLKRLLREKTASSRWLACWASHTQFKVKNGLQSFIVDFAKDIVVEGNGKQLAYHVPMQFPAYSSTGKMLNSMCTCVFMSPHIRSVISQ